MVPAQPARPGAVGLERQAVLALVSKQSLLRAWSLTRGTELLVSVLRVVKSPVLVYRHGRTWMRQPTWAYRNRNSLWHQFWREKLHPGLQLATALHA
jgi:hypothetical protein